MKYHYSPVTKKYKKVKRIIRVEKHPSDIYSDIIEAEMVDGTKERDYRTWFRQTMK